MLKLTREDYKRAAKQGISPSLLYKRVDRGWKRDLAMTKKPKQRKPMTDEEKQYLDVALSNDISASVYRWRIKAGWTPFKAASEAVRAWERAY